MRKKKGLCNHFYQIGTQTGLSIPTFGALSAFHQTSVHTNAPISYTLYKDQAKHETIRCLLTDK